MRAIFSPGAALRDFSGSIQQKISRLSAAYGEGKRFLVMSELRPQEATEWVWASFLSPLAVAPIHPTLPPEAKARALAQLPPTWVEIDQLPAPNQAPVTPKGANEIWAVIFSSGSSGDPKGVAISGRALRASAEAHAQHSGNPFWLLNLPLHHIGGFSVLSRAFFLGSNFAVGGTKFDAAETAAWIRAGVRGLSLVPTTLQRLLAESIVPTDLEIILLGGAPAEHTLITEARARGFPLRLTYGMTENCSQIATELNGGSGLVPLPGVQVKIEAGEIHLSSPFLAEGVYHRGNLQPLHLNEGYFSTGDLGSYEGGVLSVQGRLTEMIITGGVKLCPAEIERNFPIPGVEDLAITSVPDAEWGERVCAAWVGNASPDTVKSYLATKIDPRKIPRLWLKLSHIPRSTTGKVLRADLKNLFNENLRR